MLNTESPYTTKPNRITAAIWQKFNNTQLLAIQCHKQKLKHKLKMEINKVTAQRENTAKYTRGIISRKIAMLEDKMQRLNSHCENIMQELNRRKPK